MTSRSYFLILSAITGCNSETMSINPITSQFDPNLLKLPSEEKRAAARKEKEVKQKEEEVKQKEEAEEKDRIEIDHETGHFTIDGERYTVAEIFAKLGAEASLRAKESLAITLQSLQDANKEAKAATEWLNTLRSLTPEGSSSSTVSVEKVNKARKKFEDEYGFDPFEKYSLSDKAKTSGSYKQSEMKTFTQGTTSFLETVNNNQQQIQLDIERYTHLVEELNQMMASINKSNFDTDVSIANKIV